MNLTDAEKRTVDECKRVWEMACVIYKVPDTFEFVLLFSDNKVLRKRSGCHAVGYATVASAQGCAVRGEVRLNRKAITQDLDDTLKDTIPHEIAHIICGIFPDLGCDHNAGWAKVCRRLGGDGQAKTRAETYDLRMRIRWKHKYRVDSGREVWLTDVKHNRIQSGNSRYRFPDTREAIEASHYTREKK